MPDETTVLIIENETSLREDLVELVTELGFSSFAAPNRGEALETFNAHCGEIEIVLLDIGLPDGSGLDIIGDLRQLDPHVVIIVLSGYLQEDDNRDIANRKGVFDIVAKGASAIRTVVRLLEQANVYRRVLHRCRQAEHEQAALDAEPISRSEVGHYLARCLELLEQPFADETQVRLIVGQPLETVWELVPESSREHILEPESRPAREIWREVGDRARVLWLRQDGAQPEWVRDLTPDKFPLRHGAALIPLAPSDQLLGLLELRAEAMEYRHYKILERWRRFCDLWAVRLLTRLSAALEQLERLRQLRYTLHELSGLSRHFESFVDHFPDLDVRRRFERQLDKLSTEIANLQIERHLLEPGGAELTPYDPNLILFEVQHHQAANLEALGGHWQLELDDTIRAISLDRVKFGSAIENLVINAIEAHGSGTFEEPEIGLRSRLVGEKVRIEVWDNGPGISPEVADPFDRGYSSKGPVWERGDGLDLVREAIERMGGAIEYVRSEDPGSRFVMTFSHLPETPPPS